MTFTVYERLGSLKTELRSFAAKYRKNKMHKAIKPGDEYDSNYKFNNKPEKIASTSTLEFIARDDFLVEMLNVELSTSKSGKSLAKTNKSETVLGYLQIDPKSIIKALGPEGVLVAIYNTDTAYKAVVKSVTLPHKINFIQNQPQNQTDTVMEAWNHKINNTNPVNYDTDEIYEITYERVTQKFIIITTNLGISNYASIHMGTWIPVGSKDDIFQLADDNKITWKADESKISSYINRLNPKIITHISIDKGKKLLLFNSSTSSATTKHFVYRIPKQYFNGEPVVPNNMTFEDYLLEYNNSNDMSTIFSCKLNTADHYDVIPFPFAASQTIIPYYKKIK